MMKFKTSLLTATIVAGFAATAGQAQVALPAPGPNDSDAALHGAGATSIQNVLVREMNCIGIDKQLGNGQPGQSGSAATTGSLKTIAAGSYDPTSPDPTTNPTLHCATDPDIQPAFAGKYVGTGSGFGRRMWRQYKDDFDGSPSNGVTHVFNPFNTVNGDARWSHLQFAFSDTPIAPSDLTDYNNGGTDATTGTFTGAFTAAGPAIQFPEFVLPVAIAYNPVYGKNAGGTNMTFHAKFTSTINTVANSSIRMTRKIYCEIFNGDITNWNDPLLKTANGNTSLQDTVNDTPTRWAADGAPIRLVGRLDNSGTTDVFTRHLASVCGIAGNTVTTNKYLRNAESLPYNGSTGVDYTTIREDSNYKPATFTSSPTKFAGSTNTVSGDYWNDATKAITYIGSGPHSAPTGHTGSGLYIVANGGGQLANAINAAPDYVLNGVTLNGKVGYISADFIPPSKDAPAGLVSAQLQIGTGTTYAAPSLFNALKAFGAGTTAILPPESTSAGAYATGDTRQVRNAAGATVNATRDNPLAWTDVLYVTTNGNNLAAPLAGYPIVGTTQFFGYTCYTTNNRLGIVELLGLGFGGVTKNSTGGTVSVNTFKGSAAAAVGIFDQSNIGVLPVAWQAAIRETFLKNSTQVSNGVTLGSKNLWIQNKYILSATKSPGDTTASPVCSSHTGA